MGHVEIDGVVVDYDIVGRGDEVALLHARPFVRWYEPLVAARSGHRVLRYHRTVPVRRHDFGLGDDAEVCARLLDHVGFDHPHVVGHSYGGCLALEVARRGDVAARSVAVLEPATTGLLEPDEAARATAPLIELYRSRGPETSIEQFLRLILGDDARALLDGLVPGAFEDALVHSEQFFSVELPALVRWSFGPDDAASIEQPILCVLGAESDARFARAAEIVATLFPRATGYTLPGAGHLLMAQNPAPLAEELERFWSSSDG